MINQVLPVKEKTGSLPTLNKGLLQARHIQARLKRNHNEPLPTQVEMWSPITAGPILVPVTRWIE